MCCLTYKRALFWPVQRILVAPVNPMKPSHNPLAAAIFVAISFVALLAPQGVEALSDSSGSIFEWDLHVASASDIGAVSVGSAGTDEQVPIGSGATLSGTGGAVFRIVLGGNLFTDVFWKTDKRWANILSGASSRPGSKNSYIWEVPTIPFMEQSEGGVSN